MRRVRCRRCGRDARPRIHFHDGRSLRLWWCPWCGWTSDVADPWQFDEMTEALASGKEEQ